MWISDFGFSTSEKSLIVAVVKSYNFDYFLDAARGDPLSEPESFKNMCFLKVRVWKEDNS